MPLSKEQKQNERITVLEVQMNEVNKKLSKIASKIDSLSNGGLSSAIQEQNEKQMTQFLDYLSKVESLRKQELEQEAEAEKQKRNINLKKYQTLYGLIGGGIGIKLLDILYQYLQTNVW